MKCQVCGREIKTMIFRGTGVCSDNCRKIRQGEADRVVKTGGSETAKNDEPYPIEVLDEDDDDGTMPGNVETLTSHVVGHRIVKVEQRKNLPEIENWDSVDDTGLILTLDNGKQVTLRDSFDCCAYTDLKAFLLHPDRVDHIITGVDTTKGYTRWHIYADAGDVLELAVDWSSGNPFYYGYGFYIDVTDVPGESS